MVKCFGRGWATTLMAITLTDAYVGTIGAVATPPPAGLPPIFTAPLPGLVFGLMGNMQWAGPSSFLVANALLSAPTLATIATTLVIFPPIPGGGLGTGTLSKATCPAILRTATESLFIGNIMNEFNLSGKFNKNDIVPGALTPEIAKLVRSVAKYYAIILESLTLVIPYAGPTGPSPFAFVNAGKFV
jgi:hypothetical protein